MTIYIADIHFLTKFYWDDESLFWWAFICTLGILETEAEKSFNAMGFPFSQDD